VLDQALLRPGRFDRRIAVQPPDRKGRVEILMIHTRVVPLAPDADLQRIAASTPGATGADIALIVNEAALFAARRGHAAVEHRDFTDAIEKIILGAERQVVMTDADRERTAYHESGHALVGMLTPGADPVRKISIIPRGQALGVTLSTPETDRFNYARDELVARIKVALGGRAAEKVVFGDLTTGAESDIQNLTQIARGMVGRWGMSDAIGAVAVADARQDGALLPGSVPASPLTQQLVDEEVRSIVDGAEEEVIELLSRERARLDSLARALLERETLEQPEAYAVAGVELAEAEADEEAKAAAAAP
jgi:cell division protease FtsH